MESPSLSSVGNKESQEAMALLRLYDFDKLKNLQKKDIHVRFYDYDGTLFSDDRRYEVDENLRNYRGDTAIPYIRKGYKTVRRFVDKLEPSRHLLKNKKYPYNPYNPDDIILTAGPKKYQRLKVRNSGFPSHARLIGVKQASSKPVAMLNEFLRRGYLPSELSFFDDRIENFDGVADFLKQKLGIKVNFYKAIPDYSKNTVHFAETTRQSVNTILTNKN